MHILYFSFYVHFPHGFLSPMGVFFFLVFIISEHQTITFAVACSTLLYCVKSGQISWIIDIIARFPNSVWAFALFLSFFLSFWVLFLLVLCLKGQGWNIAGFCYHSDQCLKRLNQLSTFRSHPGFLMGGVSLDTCMTDKAVWFFFFESLPL